MANHPQVKYPVGTQVEKFTGDYQLPGTVIAVGYTSKGKLLYLVEHMAGFCHVYSESNLRNMEPHRR